MKVRCSNGLQVASYHGNFIQHTFGADLEFGVIDADKAMGVMFSYDGKLDSKLDAHFQCALLYTTASGERRVRCTNTVASVSEGASMESMRFIDQDAVVSMCAREGLYCLGEYLSYLLTKMCSCDENDRTYIEGHSQCTYRKDYRHTRWLSEELLYITSSRPACATRKSQRIQYVHAGIGQVAGV